jgi:glycosyltransferase involved in cell wall biosynthesis
MSSSISIIFSIIIPHYNTPSLLARLLNSIPFHPFIEVIIIDDHSDKETALLNTILEQHKHKNLKFFKNESSTRSAGTCRNIGLNHALGKWVLFADSDDYFNPKFNEVIRRVNESNSDIIYFKPLGDINFDHGIYDRVFVFQKLFEHQKQLWQKEINLKYKMVVPWSKLYRLDMIKQKQIKFEDVIAGNDVMFSTIASYYAQTIEIHDTSFYHVTSHANSITASHSYENLLSRVKVFIRRYEFLKINLESKQFSYLNLTAAKYIIAAIHFKLPLNQIMSLYTLLKRHQVKLFSFRVMNKASIKNLIYKIQKVIYFKTKSYKKKKT